MDMDADLELDEDTPAEVAPPCDECGAYCTSDAACLAVLAAKARWWQ